MQHHSGLGSPAFGHFVVDINPIDRIRLAIGAVMILSAALVFGCMGARIRQISADLDNDMMDLARDLVSVAPLGSLATLSDCRALRADAMLSKSGAPSCIPLQAWFALGTSADVTGA